MPHDGLMHITKMTEAEAALKKARLHLRSGKRRLQKGFSAAGIVALYDSVLLECVITSPGMNTVHHLWKTQT